jgi:hypothetical protein
MSGVGTLLRWRIARVAHALALSLATSACGGGDDASGDTEAWCDAFRAQGSSGVPLGDDPAVERMVEVAPDEIREASQTYLDFSNGESPPDIRQADEQLRAFFEERC